MAEAETEVVKPPPPQPVQQQPASPAPAPVKQAPKPSVAERANADIASAKRGFGLLRPLIYTGAFIKGTMSEMFDGLAYYGRKGLLAGAVVGVVAGLTGGLGLFVMCAGAGFLGGMALGGAKGLLLGGYRAVGREYRRYKYADELIQREESRAVAPPNRKDYRAAIQQERHREGVVQNQFMERVSESASTFWRDMVGSDNNSHNRGIGF